MLPVTSSWPCPQDDDQELLREGKLLQGWERVYPDPVARHPEPKSADDADDGREDHGVEGRVKAGSPSGGGGSADGPEAFGGTKGGRKKRRHASVEAMIR